MQRFTRLGSLLIAVATAASSCFIAVHGAPSKVSQTKTQSLRSIAQEAWLRGDIDTAEDTYRSAITEAEKLYGPKSGVVGDLYYEIGTLALENGKFDKAENWLNQAVEIKPNSTMVRVKLAQLYRQQRNNPQLGIRHIQQALWKTKGTSLQARQELVSLLMMQNAGVHPVASAREAFTLKALVAGQTAVRPPETKLAMTAIAPPKPVEPPKKVEAEPPKAAAVMPVLFKLNHKPEEKKPEPPPEVKKKPPVVEKPPEKAKPLERPKVKPPKVKVEPPKKKPPVVEKPPVKPKSPEKPKQPEKPVELKATTGELVVKTPEVKPEVKPPKKEKPPEVAQVKPPKVVKTPHGMVPPPPPMVPSYGAPPVMFQPPPTGFTLQTDARVRKPDKPKEQPKVEHKDPPKESTEEKAAPAQAHPSGDPEDPDFLIDWGGVQKKKKAR